jgi:hypothetical protein
LRLCRCQPEKTPRRESKQVKGRRGDGEVYAKSLEMRHFQVLAYPVEPELAPSWAAGVARDGKNERNGFNRDGWMLRLLVARRPKRKSWFRRLAARRGVKGAVMAVAHTMLIIGYDMSETGRGYPELGGDYLEQIDKDQLQRYFMK